MWRWSSVVVGARTAWKGFLKFGPLTCGIKLVGATSESEKIHFKTLSRKTRHTVRSVYVDEETGEEVPADNQAKGFEVNKGSFVVAEKEEIDALKPVAAHMMEIEAFVAADSIDRRFMSKPYYVLPADAGSREAYAIIREALRRKKAGALSQIVLYQRGRQVVVEAMGNGLVVTTIRPQSEMIAAKDVFAGLKTAKIDPEITEFAGLLVDKKRTSFDPSKFEDRYETALAEMIRAKQSGKAAPKKSAKPREHVSDLAKLLKKSLEREGITATERKKAA